MTASRFSTINPATEEQIETFHFFTAKETEAVLARADESFKSWGKLPVHRRAELLAKLAATLRKNKADLAKVITTEMGKILSEAEGEVEKCAWEADWYAEHGPQMFADSPAATGKVEAYVSYLPLGPILGIMPWNFPLWQVTRMAIPTLLAGNVVLIKHSPNTQRSSLELERVILEAGFPEGALQNLILKTEDIGRRRCARGDRLSAGGDRLGGRRSGRGRWDRARDGRHVAKRRQGARRVPRRGSGGAGRDRQVTRPGAARQGAHPRGEERRASDDADARELEKELDALPA